MQRRPDQVLSLKQKKSDQILGKLLLHIWKNLSEVRHLQTILVPSKKQLEGLWWWQQYIPGISSIF